MRLKSFQIQKVDHIENVAVDNLSDVVVIAGPNGVGKSRLIRALIDCLREPNPASSVQVVVEATSEFERETWKKNSVNSKEAADIPLFHKVLRRTQKRSQYRSSVLNFESDPAVRNVAQYGFSWDIPDPDEENIGWDFG